METIFDEIEGCLAAGLYYAAVSIALTIPDLCAALRHPVGHVKGSNKAGYQKWWSENLAHQYPELTLSDVYSLRSGITHNGRFGGGSFSRVIFTPISRIVTHRNTVNDALNLDAATFCGDIVAAAVKWFERPDVQADKNVARNMVRIVQYHPNGFLPYIDGIPVVA